MSSISQPPEITAILAKNQYANVSASTVYHVFHNEGAKHLLTHEAFHQYLEKTALLMWKQEFEVRELICLWFSGVIPNPPKGTGAGVASFRLAFPEINRDNSKPN